jgi:hypothetical protein
LHPIAFLEKSLGMAALRLNVSSLALLLLICACDPDNNTGNATDGTGLGANGLKLSGIGDSIMQGFDANACGASICFDEPEYSFAQGTSPEVRSLYLRFDDPGIEFVSVTGAAMIGGSNNAKAQANRLCQQATRPNRIVILLGANDICQSDTTTTLPTAEEFSLALSDALSVLVAESCDLARGSSIHVMSVPRIDFLQTSGIAKADVDCASIWQNFDICRLATNSPSLETMQAIAATVQAYNQSILETVTRVQASVDGSRELTLTTDYVGSDPNTSFGTYQFAPDDLSSLDCFHPSVEGQRKLACMAWESWQGSLDLTGCL